MDQATSARKSCKSSLLTLKSGQMRLKVDKSTNRQICEVKKPSFASIFALLGDYVCQVVTKNAVSAPHGALAELVMNNGQFPQTAHDLPVGHRLTVSGQVTASGTPIA